MGSFCETEIVRVSVVVCQMPSGQRRFSLRQILIWKFSVSNGTVFFVGEKKQSSRNPTTPSPPPLHLFGCRMGLIDATLVFLKEHVSFLEYITYQLLFVS